MEVSIAPLMGYRGGEDKGLAAGPEIRRDSGSYPDSNRYR